MRKRKPGKPSRLPDVISPEVATLTDKAPAGDAWVHEIKLDSYRTAARIEAGKVRMLTRSGLDWTQRFRPIAGALAVPKIRAAYLDGEIAVLCEDGVTTFAALQDAVSRGQLTYHVFDLLHLDGRDLTGLPLIERKALLTPLPARLPKGEPCPLFRSCAGPGPRLLRPGLQAPPRGHRLQVCGGTLSLPPDRGLAEGEVSQPPGVCHRRLDGIG